MNTKELLLTRFVIPSGLDNLLESLNKAGFTAKIIESGFYEVRSMKTGAIVNASATVRDLRSYVTCAEYIQTQEPKREAIAFPHMRGAKP